MRTRLMLHPLSREAAEARRSLFGGYVMEDDPAGSDPTGGDPQGGDNDDPAGGDGGVDDTDPRVKRANQQAAALRVERNELRSELTAVQEAQEASNAVLEALRKALDPNAENGDGTDPAETIRQSTERITALETENTGLRAELLVYELAADHNANAVKLLDSRSFAKTLTGLDPAADDYRDQVADAIKSAVDNDTTLRNGQAPSRGGADNAGGAGGNSDVTAEQFKDMSYADRVELNRTNPTLYRQLADA